MSSERRSPVRIAVAWLLVAACVAVILTFSGAEFSSASTSRYLLPLLRWFWPDVPADLLGRAHLLVRKSAHLIEYAALALLSWRALWLSFEAPLPRLAGLALALVLVVAAVDETRQARTPSRGGSPWDVALDVTGGLLALGALLALRRRPRAPAQPPVAG